MLDDRPWTWLESCIEGLLNAPPRVLSADGRALPATRLGWALHPPDAAPAPSS